MTHALALLWNRLLLALGFLTRLGPARLAAPEELGASLGLFPVVGLLLGLALAAPFHPALLGGLAHDAPWVQAWLLAGLNLWLTRGLHWDGWADLWDAWGSGTQGTRFWEVVKDSHTGAFGAIALVMGLGGQIVLLHHALAAHALGTIVFAAVLGRCAAAVLAFLAKSHARQGLGQAFLRQATPQRLAAALALTLALGLLLVPGATLALSLALTTLALLALLRLAREQQGCNGDFLGAAITTAELATLLGFALAG